MELDPVMVSIVAVALVVLVVSLLMKRLRQPYVVAFIIAGTLIGPQVLGLVTDVDILSNLGALGIVLLLFFVGMEVSISKLIANWKIAIIGTLLQIVITVAVVFFIMMFFPYSWQIALVIGFIISLSSTAVVLNMLQEWKELDTKVGQNVLSVLLVQDLAVILMIISMDFITGKSVSVSHIIFETFAGIIVVGILGYLIIKQGFNLPFKGMFKQDHEMQLMLALIFCFGFSALTGFFGISSALGAFVAGIVVSSTKQTDWIHQNLKPLKTIFVALFFLYVGMLIDFSLLLENIWLVIILVATVFLINTFINAAIFRVLGGTWKESIYGGALLAQIGEFSFLLAAVAVKDTVISGFFYSLTVGVIAITLLLSPLWITLIKKTLQIDKHYRFQLPHEICITLPQSLRKKICR